MRPLPLPPRLPRPPSGGRVCDDPPPTEELPPLILFRLKVVPGPEPNPLAAWSSMLETDLSILLSSLRTQLVLEDASPMSWIAMEVGDCMRWWGRGGGCYLGR